MRSEPVTGSISRLNSDALRRPPHTGHLAWYRTLGLPPELMRSSDIANVSHMLVLTSPPIELKLKTRSQFQR